MITYLRLMFVVDGSLEFRNLIRSYYHIGMFGNGPKAFKRFERLDAKNFLKWRNKN